MLELFFPNCAVEVQNQDESILELALISEQKEATCPDCGYKSKRVHSYYYREPSDLPFCGWLSQIRLLVKRFRCLNVTCPRATFVETLADWLAKYAHRTHRLQRVQGKVAVYLGAEAGACLLTELGMPISPDSLLSKLRSLSCESAEKVKVLGVDDFSFRRGKTFGTILVDLEKQQTIELLENRSAETLIEWLKKHPEIEIISRDRSADYTRAATNGAPQAAQVADRWHLLVNLSDVIETWLYRHQKYLVEPATGMASKDPASANNEAVSEGLWKGIEGLTGERVLPAGFMPSNTFEEQRQAKLETRAKRLAQYEKAKDLKAKGLRWKGIAAEVGKGTSTLRRWLKQGFPDKQRGSLLDPYRPYLKQRFEEGCLNGRQLYLELKTKGFEGSVVLVQNYLALLRRGIASSGQPSESAEPLKRAQVISYTPRECVFYLPEHPICLGVQKRQDSSSLKKTVMKPHQVMTFAENSSP